MKNGFTKKLLALVLIGVMILSAVACGGDDKSSEDTAETTTKAPAAEEPAEDVSEEQAAEEEEAEEEPASAGVSEDTPLVLQTSELDGKFSAFFYTSAYDNDVQEKTALGLLDVNKDGEVIAGPDENSVAQSFTIEPADDNSQTTYTIVLKNDLVFSDGEALTVDDVLFSMYVLSDPYYDGSSTFYSLNIDGMAEYRLQTSTEMVEVGDDILAAGISGEAGAEPVLGDGLTVATAEQQAAFWSYLDEAGQMFAQEITDYVNNNYLDDDYAESALPGYSVEDIQASETLQTAFGMAMWGFGGLEDETFSDANGEEYDLSDDSVELDASVYWNNIVGAYGYDLDEETGINVEKAGDKNVEDYVQELFYQNEGGVEGGVDSITGITTETVTGDDGEEHDAVVIELIGIDPTAEFKMGVTVAPKHYYTEGYEGELTEFGVDPTSRDFLEFLKTKNDRPVGAGPYIFESYQDNVVTYSANPNFHLGEPKIKTLRYQVLEGGSELDALLTDTVHFAEPSASQEVVSDISSGAGDYAKLDYILVDNDGYGYIGINSQAIPEWNVRKALAHAFNVQLSVDNYYGELASASYRPMTKVQWAYPDNPEQLYPYDESGETSKELLLEEGYIDNDGVIEYPADHEKAGEQFTLKFTLPMGADDHPAGSIFLDTQKVLEGIGVKVDIEVDTALLGKLSTAYESGIQVWTAAWGSGGVDPDMFQIWYSDPTVNLGNSPNNTGLFWLFENGTEDQKAVLAELNELIIAGRTSVDKEERKPIYANALELASSLAVEVPTYQRKNMFAYNADVINPDTLLSGDDVTPFQSPLAEIWNVELNW